MPDQIKIKVTYPFPNGDLRQQLPSGHQDGPAVFYVNPSTNDETVYDYWVVYEALGAVVERTQMKRANATIFITGEPPTVKKYPSIFLNQFDLVVTCHPDLKHRKVFNYQQSLPWTFKKTYSELDAINDIPKSKLISIISSNKTITDGHKKRLEFSQHLHALYPGQIDLFGRGLKDFDDKWDTLAPYKFHVCIENSSLPDYFTEKISDSFLALSFPLYHGCSNIEEYFDPRCFRKIDISNIDACRKVIDELLENDSFYDAHLAQLKIARRRCLDEYNLFPFIERLVSEKMKDVAPVKNSYRKLLLQSPKDMLKTQIKRLIRFKN